MAENSSWQAPGAPSPDPRGSVPPPPPAAAPAPAAPLGSDTPGFPSAPPTGQPLLPPGVTVPPPAASSNVPPQPGSTITPGYYAPPPAAGAFPPAGYYAQGAPGSMPVAVPPGPGWGAPTGWTPPPKPGLIPLRPHAAGEIFGAAFRLVRSNPKATFTIVFVVSLITGIISSVFQVLYTEWLLGQQAAFYATGDYSRYLDFTIGAMFAGLAVTLVLGLVSMVVGQIMQAILVADVGREVLGETPRFGQVWELAKPRMGAAIGWGGLLLLIVLGVFAVCLGPVFLVAFSGAPQAASGLAVLSFIGIVLLGGWLLVKLALTPSAIVLEHRGVGAAMRRSWQLTRGFFGKVLGTHLLVYLVMIGATLVSSVALGLVFQMIWGVVDPLQLAPGGDRSSLYIQTAISLIPSVIISTFSTIALAGVAGLLAIDLRMRTEGLDLTLTRYVEERAAGRVLPDPYLTQPYDARHASGPSGYPGYPGQAGYPGTGAAGA